MKQIIIFLLLIIVGILGYNAYSKYKRFNPPGSTYQAPANIDLNYYDQEVVADYHQAVAKVNGHVAQMWSFHSIDVRAPKKDNEATKAAVATYEELMAKLKGLEAKLQESARLKEAGMNNVQIEAKEMGLDTAKASLKSKKEMLLGWLETAPSDFEFGIGSEGPLVYEIQGILIKMGYQMEHDGIYQLATTNAVESFERKNGFYADGRMDPLTAYALLAN